MDKEPTTSGLGEAHRRTNDESLVQRKRLYTGPFKILAV